MKKTLQLFLALLASVSISAQTFDDGTFTYNVTDATNSHCEVTGLVTPPSAPLDIVIPGTATYSPVPGVNTEYTVTAVGAGAFSCNPNKGGGFTEYQNIENVTLPASVTVFNGAHSFRDNPNLVSINLDNVEDLGSNAFTQCTGLTGEINLLACTNLGSYPFFNCSSITALNTPVAESCGDGAYYNMIGVKEFNIPSSLMNFGKLFLGWNDALVQVQLNWDATELGNVVYVAENFFRGEDFANTTKKIYVPEGTKDAYETHELWGQFPSANIIEGAMPVLSTDNVDAKALGFSLYPNPTRGIVSITNSQVRNAEISVYDINGRTLLTKNTNNALSEINISNLANGMYLFKVKTDSNEFVKRIIKQ